MVPKAGSLTAWPPHRFTPLTIAIAALGGVLVLGREFTFGVTLGADSASFVAAARSLLAGEGLLGFAERHPYVDWPPLYPLLLAAASLGIFDPVTVAGPLNAIIFGLTVFVVGNYLQQRLESRFLAAWGCLATALAVPLTKWSSWALSEPLFVLLTTLALVQTDRFLTEGRLRTLIWAAALSALAWQARYIGGAVPACVGLLLLFHPRAGTTMAQRVRRVTVYSLIVAVPMALWLLRNLLTTGKFTMHRPPIDYAALQMLRDVVEILWSWAPINTAAILVPFVCILVVVRWKRLTVADWLPCWLFGGFALTYLVSLIVIISLFVGVYLKGGVSGRWLIPLYIPLLIACLFMLDRVLWNERERQLLGSVGRLPIIRTMPGKQGSVLFAIVTIVLSLGAASQIAPNVSAISKANRSVPPIGYLNGPHWTGSETLQYLRGNVVAAKIYSNAPHPVSLHLGKDRKYSPYHALPASPAALEWNQDDVYVVWFHEALGWYHGYGEADLRRLPDLKPVAELADGVVFKVTR